MPCSPQAYTNKRKDISYGPSPKGKGLKHPWAEKMSPLEKLSALKQALPCLGAQQTQRGDEMTGCQ